MEEKPVKMKKPWLAALLNFILPGLGFIYVGTVGWIVGGIILIVVTLVGKFTPVVWPITGAGIPQISGWFVLALLTSPICQYGAKRRNRKIGDKAKLTEAQPPPPITYRDKCPFCGLEIQPEDVFCPNCGRKIRE